jgi:predicted HicB family RNase H-like nuclease
MTTPAKDAKAYSYRIEWNEEENAYVGLVSEFPALKAQAPSLESALAAIQKAVSDLLTELAQKHALPPKPWNQRQYSGRLVLRLPPSLHRRLAQEAEDEGVSLNTWIVTLLAGRRERQTNGDEEGR